jgi:hypothetical protein
VVTTSVHAGMTRPTHLQKHVPKDIDKWLDRNQASDLLGVSPNTLMNLGRRGKLHPMQVARVDRAGAERIVYVYDPAELAKIPTRDRSAVGRSPGEVAARVFELLDVGKSLREIVVEVRESPELVEQLRDKWTDMGGADRVITMAAWERLEAIIGPFGSVSDLIELVERAVAKPAANDR